MPNSVPELQLTGVEAGLHAALNAAATAWSSLLNEHLLGITVVGSCLTPDYRPGRSDINTMLVVDDVVPALLDVLTSSMRTLHRKHHLAIPLLMTEDYLARSRDVFGIEFLDFQLTHDTVWGSDPFVDLSFAKPEVRLQCERELKADLIRLRQGYITASGKDPLICEVLMAGVKSLGPLLRAMLWLHDQPREAATQSTFRQAAAQFSFDAAILTQVAAWRQKKSRPKGPEVRTVFAQVYQLIHTLAATVDALGEAS